MHYKFIISKASLLAQFTYEILAVVGVEWGEGEQTHPLPHLCLREHRPHFLPATPDLLPRTPFRMNPTS